MCQFNKKTCHSTMTDLESAFKEISAEPGVIGTMVLKMNGLPVKTTFSDQETLRYAGLITEFVKKAKGSLENTLVSNPLNVIRIRSHKNEIIITPEGDYMLVVVQDASASV